MNENIKDLETSYMHVKDVAKKLDISKRKAYALVKTDGFPSIRIGGTYRVSKEGFEKWLKENEGSSIDIDE